MNKLSFLIRRIHNKVSAFFRNILYNLKERSFFKNYSEYQKALTEKESGRITLLAKGGLKVLIRKNIWDAKIVKEIFIVKPYLQFCKLPEKPIIVDIGGYIGDFSLYCTKYLKASKVIVYEPTRENFEVLLENININGFNNIEAVNNAVGVNGELTLNVQSLENGEIHVSQFWYDGCERRTVKSISLEELYNKHNLVQVDLLKIDCEGGEYEILPNISDRIINITKNVVFEFHTTENFKPKLKAIKERLQFAGFTLKESGMIISALR